MILYLPAGAATARLPSALVTVFPRPNGKFFLHIVAHPDFGLPFGQDRLIPIWIATLAVKQKTRAVQFANAVDMLSFFHFPNDGRYYARMVEGFKRIFAASISRDSPGKEFLTISMLVHGLNVSNLPSLNRKCGGPTRHCQTNSIRESSRYCPGPVQAPGFAGGIALRYS
jgi:hypothetical protein